MSMKTNSDKVYSQKGQEAFGTAMFFLTAFPVLCTMLLVVLMKNILPFFLPWMIQGVGIAFAVVFMGYAAEQIEINAYGESDRKKIRFGLQKAGQLLTGGGAWAISLLFVRVLIQWGVSVLPVSFKETNIWVTAFAWLFFSLFDSCVISLFGEKALRTSGKSFRAGKWIFAFLMIFSGAYLIPALLEMITALTVFAQSSFMRMTAYLLLRVLIQWLFCWPAFYKLALPDSDVVQLTAGMQYETMQQNISENRKSAAGFALVLMAVLFAGVIFTMLPTGKQKTVLRQVYEMTQKGDEALTHGDLLAAASYYETAQLRKNAWYEALSEQGNISDHINGDYLLLLLVVDEYFDEQDLYGKLLCANVPDEFYIYYLEQAKKEETNAPLNEEYKYRQHEVAKYCALHGIWTGHTVVPEDFNDRQKQELINMLVTCQEQLNARGATFIYRDMMVNGGVLTLEMAEEAVALAEQYPDSLYLQGVAMQMAAGFSSDLGGNCYEEGIAAAKHYDRLFYELNPEASEEEMAAERIMVAKSLIRCLDLEGAKALLEKTLGQYQNEALWYTYAGCLYRMKEYADCVTVTGALYDAYQNPAALGLHMLSLVLQEENRENLTLALKDALKLSQYAKESGDIVAADAMLFSLAQAFAGVNISDRNLYENRYRSFSEEELALLSQDPFLESMVKACTYWQNREYEEALVQVNLALNMESDWSNLHYLKGCILFEMSDYEAAGNSFIISLECNRDNAATWFMLGHCYDRLKEYDLSSNAFRISNQLLPNSEHDLDYYGIGLHAERAYEQLQDYIDKGVRR